MASSGHAPPSYRKRYQQSSQAVGLARQDVVAFAADRGFSGQSLDDIEVAVGEGLANAVEHAFRGDGGIEVSVWHEADALIIEIKDSGRGFDHKQAASVVRPPAEAVRGFGMFIMRELMDDVRYSDFGTRLQLRKRLPEKGSSRSALRA